MPRVRKVQPGVWHWEAPHPDWEPSVAWHHTIVSSYAIDDGERLLLFDPLAVPSEIEKLAAEREPVVVLTCPVARARHAEPGGAARRTGVRAPA
jgi:hypothetical protein